MNLAACDHILAVTFVVCADIGQRCFRNRVNGIIGKKYLMPGHSHIRKHQAARKHAPLKPLLMAYSGPGGGVQEFLPVIGHNKMTNHLGTLSGCQLAG